MMDIESDRVAKARNQFFLLTVIMLAVLVISGIIIISSVVKEVESRPSPTAAIIDTESKTPSLTLSADDARHRIQTKMANYTATNTITFTPSPTPTGPPAILSTLEVGIPKDATGYCWDGTFTYALYRDNACDRHNGVRYWWGLPATATPTLTPSLTYTPTLTRTPTKTQTVTFTPTDIPPTATFTKPPFSYGPGSFSVPNEMRPGKYKGYASDWCYWSRLNENGEVIVADTVYRELFYVDVDEIDSFFTISPCYVTLIYPFTPIPPTPTPTIPTSTSTPETPTETPVTEESPSVEPVVASDITGTPTP